MSNRSSSEILEDLIDSLEKIIDAQDDIWGEEQKYNYREVWKIKDDRLIPAKAEFKKFLDDYIDRRIETFIKKRNESI